MGFLQVEFERKRDSSYRVSTTKEGWSDLESFVSVTT